MRHAVLLGDGAVQNKTGDKTDEALVRPSHMNREPTGAPVVKRRSETFAKK